MTLPVASDLERRGRLSRRPWLHWLGALGATLAAAAPCAAETTDVGLAQAMQLVQTQDYGPAREALVRVIEGGGLSPGQLAQAYEGLAQSAAAERRPDEARDAFIRLLALRPDFSLPELASPLLTQPLREARTFWEGRPRPRLTHRPPEPGRSRDEPLVLRPIVFHGAVPSMVSSLTLHLRLADGSYRRIDAEQDRFEVPASLLDGLSEVELYMVARDEHGNVVAFAGSAESPIVVSGEEAGLRRGARHGSVWYRQWWVWTIVGVGLAAFAVALPIGLTVSSERNDACDTAFGSSCDAVVRF